jgi:Arc/MetJ family transcription regulator
VPYNHVARSAVETIGSGCATRLCFLFVIDDVYDWCMTRTNIDIDDHLVAEVMRRFKLATKREAVHLALSRLVGPPLSVELYDRIHGAGWEGDLETLRRTREF